MRIAAVNALRLLRAEDQLDIDCARRGAPGPTSRGGEGCGARACRSDSGRSCAPDLHGCGESAPPPDDTWLLRWPRCRPGILALPQMRRMPKAGVSRGSDRYHRSRSWPGGFAGSDRPTAAADPEQEPNANVRQAACYALGDLLGLLRLTMRPPLPPSRCCSGAAHEASKCASRRCTRSTSSGAAGRSAGGRMPPRRRSTTITTGAPGGHGGDAGWLSGRGGRRATHSRVSLRPAMRCCATATALLLVMAWACPVAPSTLWPQ